MRLPLLVPAAVLVGALLPVQFALNSALTAGTHTPVATAGISYGTGALVLGAALAARHQGRVPLRRLTGAPAWSYLGGVIGSAYVIGSVVLTNALGAALAVTLVIAAQVTTSLALEHFGPLGLTRRRMNVRRAAAVLLILVALALQVV